MEKRPADPIASESITIDESQLLYTQKTRKLLNWCSCVTGLIIAAGITANVGLKDVSFTSVIVGAAIWLVSWYVLRRAAFAWHQSIA